MKLFFVLANQVNFLHLTQEGGNEEDVEVKADVVLLLHVVEEPGLVPVLEGNQPSAEKAGDLLASHLDAARVSGQLIKLCSLLDQNVKTFSFLNSSQILPQRIPIQSHPKFYGIWWILSFSINSGTGFTSISENIYFLENISRIIVHSLILSEGHVLGS